MILFCLLCNREACLRRVVTENRSTARGVCSDGKMFQLGDSAQFDLWGFTYLCSNLSLQKCLWWKQNICGWRLVNGTGACLLTPVSLPAVFPSLLAACCLSVCFLTLRGRWEVCVFVKVEPCFNWSLYIGSWGQLQGHSHTVSVSKRAGFG